MPLLPCKGYVQPILSVLNDNRSGLLGTELTEKVAFATRLSADEHQEAISDGTPKYIVRIKQARYWLKNQQFVEGLAGGLWSITSAGQQFLSKTGGVPAKLFRAARGKRAADNRSITSSSDEDIEDAPLEKIDQALSQITQDLKDDLLQRLTTATPIFFERAVLELLRTMGYAGDRGGVKHTGGAGDGGVDGILHFDRLELERVYVQAKRWTKPVGGPELHQFCGALSVKHAQKGVLLTTATFTASARDCAAKAPQAVRLIDGRELAGLMIEFGVGVSRTKTRVIPQIDRDFFEDV